MIKLLGAYLLPGEVLRVSASIVMDRTIRLRILHPIEIDFYGRKSRDCDICTHSSRCRDSTRRSVRPSSNIQVPKVSFRIFIVRDNTIGLRKQPDLERRHTDEQGQRVDLGKRWWAMNWDGSIFPICGPAGPKQGLLPEPQSLRPNVIAIELPTIL